MPYICTMQACEAEKVELRKEIERLRADAADLTAALLNLYRHSCWSCGTEQMEVACNLLSGLNAFNDAAIDAAQEET